MRRAPTAATASEPAPALQTDASVALDMSPALRAWVGIARAADGAGTMDKIAVCAIFKDEAPYLLEWLAFHRHDRRGFIRAV